MLLTFLAIKRHWIRPAIGILASAIVFIAIARALGHVGPRLAWYQRPDALLAGVVIAFVNAYIPESFTNRHERGIKRVMTASIVAWSPLTWVCVTRRLFASMTLRAAARSSTNCWAGWSSKRSIKPKTRTRRLSGLMNSFVVVPVVVFVSRKETMQRERYI